MLQKILGMIKGAFSYKFDKIIVQLHKSFIRPTLDFCIQAWCLHLRKDTDLLERFREGQPG